MKYKKLLLSRPYSWMNIILIGLTANMLSKGQLSLDVLFFRDALISLLMWFAGLSILEYMHNKYEYNEKYNKYETMIPFLVLIIVSIYINIFSLPIIGLFGLSVILYSSKTRSYIGRFSFLFRGFSEVSTFLLILFFHGAELFAARNIVFMVGIYFLTASRNLVGDIRDAKVDKYTLPARNIKISHTLAAGLALIPLILIESFYVALPIIVAFAITTVYGEKDSYLVHRMYIICTLFFIGNFMLTVSNNPQILSILVFIGIMLNFTYNKVPRKLDKIK